MSPRHVRRHYAADATPPRLRCAAAADAEFCYMPLPFAVAAATLQRHDAERQ